MASAAQSVSKFAAQFCNELDNNENFICSPLSVETLLGLVALGSSNDTRAELLTALDIPNEHVLRTTYSSLTRTLDLDSLSSSHPRNVTLKVVNKIYVKRGGTLKSDIQKDAVTVFRSNIEAIDFNESLAAANTINNWVANQTNNIIKEIVSSDMFNEDTALVLVNAIYFHGFWEIPFKAKDTWPGQFHVNNTTHVGVNMMSLEGSSFNYKHCSELKAKILQMFYEGGEASMVIVLPDEIEGLKTVMQQLSSGHDLVANIKSLEKTPLKVVIPKFKIETKIDLKQLLPKMGIKTIFDVNKSDINIPSSNERLYVSEAVQKAYIVVDEKGTEAAAVTRPIMRECCGRWWLGQTFIADRPYLYLLTARGLPIFYGIFRGDKSRLEEAEVLDEIDRTLKIKMFLENNFPEN